MAKRKLSKQNKAIRLTKAEIKTPELTTERSPKNTDLGRGTINHSALGALVTSKVFKMRVEKAKKGKAHLAVKQNTQGKECYQIAA